MSKQTKLTEQQLVELIANEVMAQLSKAPANAGARNAAIRPPLGTCTGDKSKYSELAGSSTGSASQSASPAPQQQVLTGFVTENQLREAIASSSQGVAVLAAGARFTPLGNDYARRFPEKIRRESADRVEATGQQQTAERNQPWLWWMQGQCSGVSEVVSERASKLRTISAGAGGDNMVRVVRELVQAIKSGTAAGGVLFVPSAARVMCLANRCASLRAVVGTCGQAVEEGVVQLGANVLVVEYPHHGPRALAAMVDRMIQQNPVVPASVQRDLADLHRCG